MAAGPGPVSFDPRDPIAIQRPLDILLPLQVQDPVHWSPALKAWVVTRYSDVKAVQMNAGMSADRLTPFYQSQPERERGPLQELVRYLNTWVAFQDPPHHTRLRTLLNKIVTPAAMRHLDTAIAEIADDLLDSIEARGAAPFDFITQFANPLPASVIMDLLGVPRGDMALLRDWSMQLQPFLGGASIARDKYETGRAGIMGMADYFRAMAAERARRPCEDVVSRFVALRDAGQISDDELIGSCILFLFAGHETTTNLIANGVRALIAHPGERARLDAQPELVDSAVEEMLRYDGPSGAVVRVVSADHELRGRQLRAGDRVFAMIHAANHDPEQFDKPARFDIARSPNRHLTFNHGRHFCLGAPLARAEARIATDRVMRRFPKLAMATDSVEYMETLIMRGLREMPMVIEG